MVLSIARYAVIRKAQTDVNIITGNYEAAYAIGLFSNLLKLQIEASEKSVKAMLAKLLEQLTDYEPKNDSEKNLIAMLQEYKPSDEWNEDVEAMLKMGLEEERVWDI